ncbi:MAG: L-fucose/L-arabinose isomerase family protein [Oscillospiraceae bacterium]|jgi:L-arabinose isomerase|nr:L-fucose/L-arabinose isomerase family protein [Oscillospiraceae bacterium]
METASKLKETAKPKIGLYSMGLRAYWSQFEGLRERLLRYGEFIRDKVAALGAEVCYYGLVDCPEAGQRCGDFFRERGVSLILVHSATYATSAGILPVHQRCGARTVLLNLQPAARINYEKSTTGEWLAHCGACPIPEAANAFRRAGIPFHVVNGLLGMDKTPDSAMADENTAARPEAARAWKEIGEWVRAAAVLSGLQNARFGFLGNYYSGMLDMYSDFTLLQARTGIHLEILEMCDLSRALKQVCAEEIRRKRGEIAEFFRFGDAGADPRNHPPSEEELDWSAAGAAAQERLVQEYGLDALSYYYHGEPGGEYERLQSGFIVGHSLLTAKGIPCAGEADVKTCLAMKICDILGVGGSFCELVVTDYLSGTILMGHDGPFHIAIAEGKPILRGLGVYHGKQGSGVSVEAKVRTGPVTNLSVTQSGDGRLKFLITEAESVPGEIMTIGNTQTPVRFKKDPDAYMDEWFAHAPTHHFAMSVGHNAGVLEKAALLLGVDYAVLDR